MILLGVFLCPNWTIRRSYGPSWEHCQWISIKWTGTGQLVVTHRCARGNRSCSQTVTRSAHCVDESLRRVNIDLSSQVRLLTGGQEKGWPPCTSHSGSFSGTRGLSDL